MDPLPHTSHETQLQVVEQFNAKGKTLKLSEANID